MHSDGALAFEKAHDGGNRMFGRDLEDHVHVIGASVALEDVHFFLFSQFPDNLPDLDANGSVENFLSVFWYNDHVVFAVPHHMAL